METIEKILTEIERKQQENLAQFNKGLINIETLTARDSQLLHIRSFIESLEKDPKLEIRELVYQSGKRDGYAECMANVVKQLGSIELMNPRPVLVLKDLADAPKIKGWVARDGCEDAFNGCGLILHHSKPWRTGSEWSSQTIAMHLPWSMFPELKWKDNPRECELIIKLL